MCITVISVLLGKTDLYQENTRPACVFVSYFRGWV
jgi:hypothetical protein